MLSNAPQILHKKANTTLIAICLLIYAVVFYVILHDVDRLHIAKYLKPFINLKYVSSVCKNIRIRFPILFLNVFIKNYLVDALWFSSLSLIFLIFYEMKFIGYISAIMLGVLSEVVQLLFPSLGTFDVYDLALYSVIITVFFIFNKLLRVRLRFQER